MFQHLIARAVLGLGWVQRKSDGSQSWHDYLRKGVQVLCIERVMHRTRFSWRLGGGCLPGSVPRGCSPPSPTPPHPPPRCCCRTPAEPARPLTARSTAWSTAVVPNGVATGLDIGFSNYSLVFITLSFYVMCKSTTPLFLLFFAIAWGIEKPSWCVQLPWYNSSIPQRELMGCRAVMTHMRFLWVDPADAEAGLHCKDWSALAA